MAIEARARNKLMNDHTPTASNDEKPISISLSLSLLQFVYDTCGISVFVGIGTLRLIQFINKTERHRSKMCKQTFQCENVHQTFGFFSHFYLRGKKQQQMRYINRLKNELGHTNTCELMQKIKTKNEH